MLSKGLMDIHCHIMSGIDDGALNDEASLIMLKQAKAEGITDIIATPHFFPGSRAYKNELQEKKLKELNTTSQKNNLAITIYEGNELYLEKGAYDAVKTNECKSLGNTRYVLVEMSFYDKPYGIVLNELKLLIDNGYVPIIAHPERYLWAASNLDLLASVVQLGCRLQLTTSSVMGLAGKTIQKLSRTMIEKDMVYCISSDAHDPIENKPMLSKAFGVLKKWVGEQQANRLFLTKERFFKDAAKL
jgi:protein-tyrosine phosphatase